MKASMKRLEWRENGGDADQNTSLHFAAACGRHQLLFNSLTLGCDVNATNHMGWTPLMQAARNGQAVCVKLLLDFGADVSIRNHFGICALSLAAASGSLETVSLVLKSYIQRGIPIFEVEKYISPVFFAVLFNQIDILRYFNKYSYNLKATIPWLGDLSPVVAASIIKNKEILSFFKRRGIIMAAHVHSPLLHNHSPNVQFFKSTPSSCKQYSLTPNFKCNVPSLVLNSPASSNKTPINTPKDNSFLNPNEILKVKKRKSSNFHVSPIPMTPCLSPIIFSNTSFYSACSQSTDANNTNSILSNNSTYLDMNSRIQMSPKSLTFSSTSSNDSSFNSLHTASRNKNIKHRSASYNVPKIPDVNNLELSDDVFAKTPIEMSNNHEFVALLRRHSLDSCVTLFEKHEIDMELFLTLSKSDLEEIGVDWNRRDDVLEVIYQCNKIRQGNRKRRM